MADLQMQTRETSGIFFVTVVQKCQGIFGEFKNCGVYRILEFLIALYAGCARALMMLYLLLGRARIVVKARWNKRGSYVGLRCWHVISAFAKAVTDEEAR